LLLPSSCGLLRYIFNVLTADAVVYLCAGKSGELKGRVAFDFLAVLKAEYERGGYEDKQNISSFERFTSAEIVRYYITTIATRP